MTSDGALVSIIVPVYGTEAYLPACIESICGQSYLNIQIILVDDQSPDRCPEICESYAQEDPRILVIHQKNTGVSGARNTGLEHASGEYILFVDSDDELLPEAVELLVQAACDYGADIVSATKRIVNERGQYTRICEDGSLWVYRADKPLLLSLEGERNTNSACAKLFRTQLLQTVRFEEGKNINEDGFFLFQCFLKEPVLVHHNVAVYQYNTRADSASRQAFSDKYLSMLYFCDRKKELIASHYPQFMNQAYNMEVRTNLQMLDLLCRTTEKKYRILQRQCLKTVRKLHQHHIPINNHHKLLERIIRYRLYAPYKLAVRLRYFRR